MRWGIMPPDSAAALEVTVDVNTSGWSKEGDITHKIFYDQLPISGVTESIDEWGNTTIGGEVSNNTNGTFSLTRVHIVFRDENGGIVGGAYTYINGDFTPGAKAPFSVSAKDVPAHASVDAYLDCGYPIQ